MTSPAGYDRHSPPGPRPDAAPALDPGAGLVADLVLEGGGVRGIALVGAVTRLQAAGYRFARVAGSSAGAIVGALVAAGMSAEQLERVVRGLDYRRFRDTGRLGRVPLLGAALSVWFEDGIYEGRYLREWLGNELAGLGVETFGDLRYDDPGADPTVEPDRRYRLVVTATDLTRHRLLRLPWDYRSAFGRDPDRERVVDAVAASTAIPFLYEPLRLRNLRTGRTVTLVDGGVLSNFPIDTFDRRDGRPPRWPTFGLTFLPDGGSGPTAPGWLPPLRLLQSLLTTLVIGHDQTLLASPCVQRRLIRIDPDDVGATDFGLSPEQLDLLERHGRDAAAEFLAHWDWPAYLHSVCGQRPTG